MEKPEKILIVDDEEINVVLLQGILEQEGYRVCTASDGESALVAVEEEHPNLLLLDVVMPGVSGYEVCQRLRDSADTRLLPIVLVTGQRPEEERVKGLDSGADEFLTKPVNREELLARVRALLRVDALHREIEEWNETLEARVQEQVQQIERMNQLKHFLPQRVAEMIVDDGSDKLLEPQRREVVVVVIDLRGFTSFSESAAPEEIVEVLKEYYALVGAIVEQHGGTVERFAGDGMVVFFNAPIEIPEPEVKAVQAAIEVRDSYEQLEMKWQQQGHELGIGIGIAAGFATVGAIGFGEQWQYAAIGSVTNLSSRLCGDARHGEILAASRVILRTEERFHSEFIGKQQIRGLSKPVPVYKVLGDNSPDSSEEKA